MIVRIVLALFFAFLFFLRQRWQEKDAYFKNSRSASIIFDDTGREETSIYLLDASCISMLGSDIFVL